MQTILIRKYCSTFQRFNFNIAAGIFFGRNQCLLTVAIEMVEKHQTISRARNRTKLKYVDVYWLRKADGCVRCARAYNLLALARNIVPLRVNGAINKETIKELAQSITLII